MLLCYCIACLELRLHVKRNKRPGIFSEMNILIIGGIGLKDFSQEWYTLFEIR